MIPKKVSEEGVGIVRYSCEQTGDILITEFKPQYLSKKQFCALLSNNRTFLSNLKCITMNQSG